MFIVFEGIDGSGKTTQAELLYNYLKAKTRKKCFLTREPTDNKIGLFVKSLIKKQEINPDTVELLFMADRAEHVREIKQAAKEKKIIICDRYYFSTIAYGSALGLKTEWLENTNKIFPEPDLTIIFDIDPKAALKRINSRKGNKQYFEKTEFLNKVRKEYKSLSKKYNNIFILNCNGNITIPEIHKQILNILKSNAPIV
ncbi:MAG: dTMP kinase [Candidatus Marsarchaeota archaeon]|nr:dTMP kinase [Candidatus Marsarchaeota archaeon]MCL5095014.1 dTMP kinase [Candidatus Marsarchaeota archaeon]